MTHPRLRATASWIQLLVIVSISAARAGTEPVRVDVRAGRPAETPRAGVRPLTEGAWRHAGELSGMPADTARLAVILVEFPADTDPNTTGDGRFEQTFDDRYETNRPPHDHAYFELQCQSVRSYFRAATAGRLEIEWTVFPPSPGVFEMPNRMRYYNPDTTDAALDVRLAEFFRDAVTVADQGAVPFSDYDYTVIFHAGVGQDLLIAEDTPSDIPSAYISLDELRESLGEVDDWMGIPVAGGTHAVTDGLWLPETENQEGIEFGITGVFAQLLGSQLGLPILFNPDSGAPGIGRFGLMDQGGGNLFGDVPALPSAWERFDRGWADARVVTNEAAVSIVARGVVPRGVDAELVVVPVDDREYFLIENRKKDLDGDGELELITADPSGANVRVGVVADEYDFGIPGSGLLIWHIDQEVIDATRAENRVNADFTRRGVKLLEADGLDDIGLRPEGGFGLPEDCYFAGNNTALTPGSNPSSRSNVGGANTHVSITAISDTAGVMTCDVVNDVVLDGFPSTFATEYRSLPPAAADVAFGDEVVVFDRDTLYVLDGGGAVVFDGALTPNDPIVDYAVGDIGGACAPCEEIVAIHASGGVSTYAPDPVPRDRKDGSRRSGVAGRSMTRGGGPIGVGQARALAFGEVDATPGADLMIATGDSVTVNPFGPTPVTFGAASPGVPVGVAGVRGRFSAGSVPWAVVVVEDTGDVNLFDEEVIATGGAGGTRGSAMTATAILRPPVFGDLDADGDVDLIAVCEDGLYAYRLGDGMTALPGWPVRTDEPLGAIALGDVDADGRLDVVVGGANRLHAFARNGVRLEGWPVTLSAFADAGDVLAEPVIADVDGDGDQDVLLASPDGLLRAFDGGGAMLPGWPIPAGRAHATAPAVSPATGGAVFVADAGTSYLHAFRAAGAAGGAHWPGARGGASRSGIFDSSLLGEPSAGGAFFPESRVYVYPNPAHERARFRYFLGDGADVEITIYDVSGLEIARLEGAGQSGVMNEVEWNLENADRERVAPGLYVARLTARGAGRTETLETKLAVYR